MATDSQQPATTATVADAGASRQAMPPRGKDRSEPADTKVTVGFFRLDWADPCNAVATDNPTATVTFTTGLRTRTIADYHGNGCMPKVLRELEDEVDRVSGTARWVGCNARSGAELGECSR